VEFSTNEIQRFAKLYPMNARPVQPLNGRVIEASP
jgi:carbonic anhydrase